MPRRRFRVVVPALCLLSLLLSVAMSWVWWRSYRIHGRVGYLAADGRYTLHAWRGRLLISGPPPNGPDDETARKPAARMSNDELDIIPSAQQRRDGSSNYEVFVTHRTGKGLPCSEFAWRYGPLPANDPASAWPPLLQALEDPGKFAAADEVLGHLWSSIHRPPWGGTVAPAAPPSSPLALAVTPRPLRPAESRGDEVTAYAGFLPIHYHVRDLTREVRSQFGKIHVGEPGVARIDASDAVMAAVRDFWHDLLDVVVWSAPLLPFAVLSALPPLLWCVSRLRRVIVRRRRTRLGLCRACGYDLRASHGTCSECGAEIPNAPGGAVMDAVTAPPFP